MLNSRKTVNDIWAAICFYSFHCSFKQIAFSELANFCILVCYTLIQLFGAKSRCVYVHRAFCVYDRGSYTVDKNRIVVFCSRAALAPIALKLGVICDNLYVLAFAIISLHLWKWHPIKCSFEPNYQRAISIWNLKWFFVKYMTVAKTLPWVCCHILMYWLFSLVWLCSFWPCHKMSSC